jgi:hypothetical protein
LSVTCNRSVVFIYYTEFNFFRITVKIRANRRLSRIMVWFIDTFENMIEIKEINCNYALWFRWGHIVDMDFFQSVPITTKFVSSNPVHGEVYSIQNYVIKCISQRHILYDVIYYTEFNFFRITVKIRANRRLSRIMVWFIDTFENMIACCSSF